MGLGRFQGLQKRILTITKNDGCLTTSDFPPVAFVRKISRPKKPGNSVFMFSAPASQSIEKRKENNNDTICVFISSCDVYYLFGGGF